MIMPPKKRSTASSKAQIKSTSSSDVKTPPASEQTPQEEQEERRRRGSKVKWSPVFKKIGYVSLIFIIPAILNYAALNQEARMLVPKGMIPTTNDIHSL